MELYEKEVQKIKNALLNLYIKSAILIPSQQQQNKMLEELAEELFTEKLKKMHLEGYNLSDTEFQEILSQLKELSIKWIDKFNTDENIRKIIRGKKKKQWWKFWDKEGT